MENGENQKSLRTLSTTKANGMKPHILNDGTDKPMVLAWMPAIAIYFDDPDGHYLEFIAVLNLEGKSENGIITNERRLLLEKK